MSVSTTDQDQNQGALEIDAGDGLSFGVFKRSSARRSRWTIVCTLVLGIIIGIGIGFFVSKSASSAQQSPSLQAGSFSAFAGPAYPCEPTDALAKPTDAPENVAASPHPPPQSGGGNWVVENVTACQAPFLLASFPSAQDKCESQGKNRVWVPSPATPSIGGKCLGRCGWGDRSGADDDTRGNHKEGRDACGHSVRHHHCCEEGPKEDDPDGVNSCICWRGRLMKAEEEKDWRFRTRDQCVAAGLL